MSRVHHVAIALLMAVPIGAAISQSPHTISLRIDNDAFDFWMQPYNRPDEEYTSGVHITYDGGPAPWWSRPATHGLGSCTAGAQRCATARLEIGQDIYTPGLAPDDSAAAIGSRPNAGWLYLSETARALRADRSDELTLTVGVTGPPSLAQQTQRIAHGLEPAFNRPTDWRRQIGFEPGVIARYEQRRWLGTATQSAFGVGIVPHLGASVGNVTTAADGGIDLRTGWHLQHPWLPSTDAPEIALTLGASGRAVARDLFLDGNTFRDSPRVGHESFVGTGSAGVEVRFRALSLAYRAVTDSRAYSAGPRWHPWSSLVGGVTFWR